MNHHDSTPTSRSWLCQHCNMCFTDKYSLFAHNKSSRHYVCGDSRCMGRSFRSAVGLREHLRQAAVHREYDHAECQRCGRQFTSMHGVLLHLDMGGCGTITWKWVLERVRRRDRRNIYVDPEADFEVVRREPCWATGTRCTTCGRSFKNTVALNQHLGSPAHQPRILKCPVDRCGSRFATFSGLAQHIEAGTKCAKRDNKAFRKWRTFVAKIGLVAEVPAHRANP
ncbi:hypothetical protein EDD85DRAFT_867693 [Armillaria nabsnona]|nr:hypothetical protein EDD85DRAFT_867693 [Armillaria nabsnona]